MDKVDVILPLFLKSTLNVTLIADLPVTSKHSSYTPRTSITVVLYSFLLFIFSSSFHNVLPSGSDIVANNVFISPLTSFPRLLALTK